MTSLAEEWRPVVGFENQFEVSDLGCVKALPWDRPHWCGRNIPQPEKIVKQSRHSGGYLVVALRDGKKHYVHKLVMAAFVEYCDRLHNVRHAIATGLQDNAGEGNGMHRYTTEQIIAAYDDVRSGFSRREAAKRTGVSYGMVEQVVTGKRWKHLGLVPIVEVAT